MQKTKIQFCDFWPEFKAEDTLLFKLLSEELYIEIDNVEPDLVFYSDYGFNFLKYNCIRVHITGENILPDFNLCDYAIGPAFINLSDRYFRLPPYLWAASDINSLAHRENLTSTSLGKKGYFCNFIYSNSNADPIRDKLFQLINKSKMVHSTGRHLKNFTSTITDRYSNDWRDTKIPFMSQFRFSIAIENSYGHGYTSEKIYHALLARTIPIYWGNPNIREDFNSDAIVNLHDFHCLEDAVTEILRIDENEAELLSILNAPLFKNEMETAHERIKGLNQYLIQILRQPKEQRHRRPIYGRTRVYEMQFLKMSQDLGESWARKSIKYLRAAIAK